MESRAKFLGHPAHQMLIVFPLGLLATAVIFDVIYLVGGGENMAFVAYWMIAAGIIGGFLAAPFGWIDWFAIPAGRAPSPSGYGMAPAIRSSCCFSSVAGSCAAMCRTVRKRWCSRSRSRAQVWRCLADGWVASWSIA